MLAAQLFRNPFSVGANGTVHLLVLRNTVSKRAATDNLLLRGRELFQIKTGLAAQLARRALRTTLKCLRMTHEEACARFSAVVTPIALSFW